MQERARIVVVEDERIVAQDLEDSLVELGYEVVANVDTGEAAIAAAATMRPDLILMDIRLAGDVDGVAAAAVIGAEASIPIIFLTAHSDEDTLSRARATAPFGYLVKPFKATELRCSVEIAIHKNEIDAKLRERERWLTTTLRSIADGVIATTADGRVTFLNPVAQALIGWSETDAVGREISEILHLVAELPEGNGARVGPRPRTDSDANEALLVGQKGGLLPVENRRAPIVGDDGKMLGSVVVLRDVSERRARDAEILRLNEELERRVVERTEQLQAANKELESFSYSIAHDLRTPLRGIDGFSQALIEDHEDKLGPEGIAHLRRVRAGAQRMGQLIDDLLRLSRIARIDLAREQVDLTRIARRAAARIMETDEQSRRVDLAVEDGLTATGDARLLEIVFENLLGNAFKFSARVTHARVTVGALEEGGERVFYVRDNGAGFDPAYAGKLFGAFQRMHAAHEFPGTGIGLAIVQRIVTRHGGKIRAEAKLDEGATFFFTL